MTKRNHKINHSRNISDSGSYFEAEMYDLKSRPTDKQRKFLQSLIIKCKKNNIDSDTGLKESRSDYAMAIDELIGRLKEHGIDVKAKSKNTEYILEIKDEKDIRKGTDVEVNMKIVIKD